MYVSDYYYAANPAFWSYRGYDLLGQGDYRVAISSNWLYSGFGKLTITIASNYRGNAFVVTSGGYVNVDSSSESVFPTFYLYPHVVLTPGDGSQTSPFHVALG